MCSLPGQQAANRTDRSPSARTLERSNSTIKSSMTCSRCSRPRWNGYLASYWQTADQTCIDALTLEPRMNSPTGSLSVIGGQLSLIDSTGGCSQQSDRFGKSLESAATTYQ